MERRSEEETLEAYTNRLKHSGYAWDKGTSIMPREEWDTVLQYLEHLRHLTAYVFLAEPFVSNKKVLEIGCGTGYGADYLSKSARTIVAIDIRAEAISYCQDKYVKNNLVFKQADGLNLPFRDEIFDVVLSFQVIEHIEPKFVLKYLIEIRRVLKKGGIFICSTPNSRLRLLSFQKPWNPEHKKEYKDEEFKKLLSKVFKQVKVCGLCGSEEIQTIECNRVKQTPFKAYIVRPFYRVENRLEQVLNDHLPPVIVIQLKKMKQGFPKRKVAHNPMPQQEAFMSKFSLNDFTIDPTCPKYCLDLYGICTKAEDCQKYIGFANAG